MIQTLFHRLCASRVLLAAVFWLSAIGATARADMISYSMILSEDINVLRNPSSSTVAHNAAWVSQHTLMLERTMPYVELINKSTTADITELSMTIGDLSKNFDWASLVDASPGVHFSLQTPDGVAGGIKSDVLTIKFTGFAPNDFVRFRTGLSPDNPNTTPIMDYRLVLFHMNAGTDTSQNSQVTVTFAGTAGGGTLTNPLPNFAVIHPTATSMAPFGGYGEDTVMPFLTPNFTGSGTVPMVPEPSSWALLAGGLWALAGLRLRGRGAA
ncbi:MAG: PEP-CTERM sorting domain-containing protein [Planctomycetia bacterium]|nr:PEP-CTERM sorting domain-containing protein [Planctomycetia bacterium]